MFVAEGFTLMRLPWNGKPANLRWRMGNLAFSTYGAVVLDYSGLSVMS